jgi:hypothetical protein
VTLFERLLARTWLHKSQHMRLVKVNGARYKRLVLHDAFIASEIERNLEAFGRTPRFPKLVTRFENEIWVEFVPGERLARVDEDTLHDLGAFYLELFSRASRLVPTSATPLSQRLQRDLEFLRDTHLIEAATWHDLTATAERITPQQLLIGFDYTDPVLKNFVRPSSGGPLCAVDVESLVRERPLGAGIAKASVFWLTPELRQQLLAPLDASLPELRTQLPFVELCFLARWTKTKFLTGRRKRVREALFAPFRTPS